MSANATVLRTAGTDSMSLEHPARVLAALEMPPAPGVPGVPILELRGVSKGFGPPGARTEVLHDINLSVNEGEFLAIVGFSGSGQSTLVNLLAGFVMPDVGHALKSGRTITGPGPDRGIVFQSYSLMPWLNVMENVQLSVAAVFPGHSAAERRDRTMHYVNMVGLAHALDRRPAELSGGMRQRVSVARALAASPDVLLLDEPLSALDALTRSRLQDEIVRLWMEDRKTVLMITNDVDEALIVADRIIPLDIGPRASLGPSFSVEIERPRDRRSVNHDENFRRIRHDITEWLIEAGRRRGEATSGGVAIDLPDLKPRMVHPRSSLASVFGRRRAEEAKEIAAPTPSAGSSDEKFVEFTRLRQRVGIARAFSLSPKLLLLDEPFGMLDSLTRWDLQEVLMEVWTRNQVTSIMVTHDVDEAILLADKVVMMTNGPNARVGRVLEIDLPRPRTRRALLEHPKYYDLREALVGFLEECDHA